jgi:hypothetical protein
MISLLMCRAKVAEWTARAQAEAEGASRRRMQQIAHNWAELVAVANEKEELGRRGRR